MEYSRAMYRTIKETVFWVVMVSTLVVLWRVVAAG